LILDGTLVDTMPLHFRAWDEAMRRAGLQCPLRRGIILIRSAACRLVASRT